MIDPFTAFAALKGATEAISKAIKTGKDLAKMSGAVAKWAKAEACLLYTSDAADDSLRVDLGGRRNI